MARISTWVNASVLAAVAVFASVLVAVAVFALVGFVATAGMNGAPAVSECVDDWNGRAGEEEQQRIAEEGYRSATVKGWLAKNGYPGCGVVFIAPEGDRVLTCTRTFAAADPRLTDWSCEWRTPAGGGSGARTTVKIVAEW